MNQNQMNQMNQFRQEIDALDDRIIELLGKRFAICRRVAHFKKAEGIPRIQTKRAEEVKQRCQELGFQRGMNRDFILDLYSLIIGESCRTEDEIIEAQPEIE